MKMLDEGQTTMHIHYEGGGDSGFIEEIHFDEKYQATTEETAMIEEWAYELLEKTLYHDWINNEGGYGYIEVDIENQTYEVDGYARTTVEDGDSGKII